MPRLRRGWLRGSTRRPTPGANVSAGGGPAAVSCAENASAAVMAASCGRGPVACAGSKRAEFRASGNSGAISPAATSSGLQAGLRDGPVNRESSRRTSTDLHKPVQAQRLGSQFGEGGKAGVAEYLAFGGFARAQQDVPAAHEHHRP